MHSSEEAWVPVGDRHQLLLTTSEAPGDWARGDAGDAAARRGREEAPPPAPRAAVSAKAKPYEYFIPFSNSSGRRVQR